MENQAERDEHVINIGMSMVSVSSQNRGDGQEVSGSMDEAHRPPSPTTTAMPTSTRVYPRHSLSVRGDGYGNRGRSPLNSGLWISVELVVTLGQIIASVVVVWLSRNEKPQAPLLAWIVGYTSGCIASLPVLFCRYYMPGQRRELNEPDSGDGAAAPSDRHREENQRTPEPQSGRRINGLVNHGKMVLDCFFAVWFVVGNVWIFTGRGSMNDAPNLYRLCIVLLTFNCIGYAMPFVLCAAICCCLPCILSFLGSRQEVTRTRGASSESIDALSKYKFRMRKGGEGGVLSSGTGLEHVISVEDAVCCICLAKYGESDEVRELPCTHFFHAECVDKWLKINCLCPLCKCEVGGGVASTPVNGE